MMVDTRNIRSASVVGRNFGAITDEVADQGTTIVVVKNNRPTVGVVPISVIDAIDSISEREEDIRLYALALVRMTLNPDPGLHDLDDVLTELGIDLGDEDAGNP